MALIDSTLFTCAKHTLDLAVWFLWYYNESAGVMPGLTREKVNRECVAIQHWEKTVEPEPPESSHKDQFLEQQL